MEDYLTITGVNREMVSLYACCWGPNCGPKWEVIKNCEGIGFPTDMLTQWATGVSMKNDGLYQTAGYWKIRERLCFRVHRSYLSPLGLGLGLTVLGIDFCRLV